MRCLRNISVYHMPRLKNLENSLVSLNLLIFKLVSFVTIVGLIGAAGQDNTLLTHSTYPNLEIGPSNSNYLQMANLGAKPLFPELGEEEQDHDDNSEFKIIRSRNSTTSPIVPINQINQQQSSTTTAVQISHPYKLTLESNNHNHSKELTTTITNSNQTYNINSYQQFGDVHLQRAGITGSKRSRRSKRSVVHLYDMVVCATGCNPLAYKGYGCYCGFLGSGLTVDGIDRCCAKHDFCYHLAKCPQLLTYFVPYYWTCNDGRPNCVSDYRGWKGVCGAHLCECDRQFAECLRKFPCPRARAMCVTSPFRYFQNLFMQPPLLPYG